MPRRSDLVIRLSLLAATLAIGIFIAIRAKKPRTPAQVEPPPAQSSAEAPAADTARDAYRALLAKVNTLVDERRYTEACETLDLFATEHPGTRWADIASRNRSRLLAMKEEVEELDQEETVERLEADLALLIASGEFDDALEALEAVPPPQRDEAWEDRRARVVALREEALRTAEPEPAQHPERPELERMTQEAERLAREGDHAAARKAAEALLARAEALDVPSLLEEFAPRASAVLELASLAEIEAVLPGAAPAGDLSKLTPRDRIRVLTSRRDSLVRFLETLPRLPQIRVDLRKHLNQARRDAMNVIFNRRVYPDEAHGVAGQGKVDEVVVVVRTAWERPLDAAAELDPVVKKAVEALRRANELLAQDSASGARPIEEVLAPLQERFSVREVAVDEWEQVVLDRNRVVREFNERVTTSISKDERKLLDLLNGYREMMGLRIMEIEEHLVMAARWHSSDMKEKQYFAHVDLEGRGPMDRAREMMYARGGVGENCATGMDDPARVHWGFYYSSGHHRNMLLRVWTHVGIGRSGQYWTQDFGAGEPQAK